jgi:hypothetical protein
MTIIIFVIVIGLLNLAHANDANVMAGAIIVAAALIAVAMSEK